MNECGQCPTPSLFSFCCFHQAILQDDLMFFVVGKTGKKPLHGGALSKKAVYKNMPDTEDVYWPLL